MGQIIKNFREFINEKTSIDDTDTEGEDIKNDSKLEDEQDEYLIKKDGICPRCGKPYPCDCQEKDSMDTNTSKLFKGKKRQNSHE
jgi:hypothetical protein